MIETDPTGERREAITEVTPLAQSTQILGGVTLALLRIHTGRTHQIRAQASFEGHPLLGDIKYGGKELQGGYFLHAFRLHMPDHLDLQAPLPKAFTVTIRRLFKEVSFPFPSPSR